MDVRPIALISERKGAAQSGRLLVGALVAELFDDEVLRHAERKVRRLCLWICDEAQE